MRKLWISAVGFLVIRCLVATGQETETQLVTPTKVSVKANESQSLVPGDYFKFQLRFDPTPHGHGGGGITAHFEKVDGPPSSDLFTGMAPRMLGADAEADLTDDLGIYNLQLPIVERMPPGKWIRLRNN